MPTIPTTVRLVRDAYQVAPDRRLSIADVERLSGLDAGVCEAILEGLAHAHFVRRAAHGEFVRMQARESNGSTS